MHRKEKMREQKEGHTVLTERVPLHDILQTKSREEHQRVAVVDLSELLVVNQSILVHIELLQSLLEIARKRRGRVVDTSTVQ